MITLEANSLTHLTFSHILQLLAYRKAIYERGTRTGMAIHPLVAASCEDKGKIYSFIDKPERVTSTILKMLYKIKK
jgi:hypothetical protein